MIWPDRLSRTVALRSLSGARRLTALTMIVVIVSVMLVVFLASLIAGLQASLVAETTGAIAHVEIRPLPRRPPAAAFFSSTTTITVGQVARVERTQARLEDWRRWVDMLRAADEELVAVSPVAAGQAFVAVGSRRVPVRVQGINPTEHDAIVGVSASLVDGRFLQLGAGEAVIGTALAADLGIELGGRIRLTTATGTVAAFRIVGRFQTGVGALDDSTVFLSLHDGQALLELGAAVTSIAVTLPDVFDAPAVAARVRLQVPHEVRDWTQDNQRLLTALSAQGQSSQLIILFTAIAAAFAVASILIVLVTNKIREIGILKAMGATQAQIRMIFALQGTMLAGGGAVLGALLGAALVEGLSRVRVAGDAGASTSLFPFLLDPALLGTTVAVALILGWLASLVPARWAARVEPIEVIRG